MDTNSGQKRLAGIVLVMLVFLSLLGGYLRSQELMMAYDGKGLLIPWHPVSLMLIGLSIASCVVLISMSFYAFEPGEGSFYEYFGASRALSVIAVIAALLLMLASLIQITQLTGTEGSGFSIFVHCFAILTSLCLIIQGLLSLSGGTSPFSSLLSVVPVFYCCFRLVYLFRGWSTDPAILDYIYKLLSVIMTTLAFYSACGFFFGKPHVRRTAAFSLLGFYFSIIAVFEGGSLADILTYQFCALYLLTMVAQIIVKQYKVTAEQFAANREDVN